MKIKTGKITKNSNHTLHLGEQNLSIGGLKFSTKIAFYINSENYILTIK